MAQPDLGTFGQDLYDALEPMAWEDEQLGWPLAYFSEGMGVMFQEVEDYARDGLLGPGWSIIVDLDRALPKGLPWLAQFVGVVTDPSLDDTTQRDRIRNAAGWRRGTKASMIAAAQAFLTGTKVVLFRERDTSAYHLQVRTYASQTPDSTRVLNALLSQKPAGIVLDYATITGQDYLQLRSRHSNTNTYTQTKADYATYGGVREDEEGA